MSFDTPPSSPPKVVFWFKIYTGFLTFLYLLTAVLSLVFFFGNPKDLDMSPTEAHVFGVILLVMGLALMPACALPLFLRPRPWLWTYNLVVICLGLTSGCTFPASIPLLIFWLKPETKDYFGKV
jgi:MFS family permease